LEATSRPLEAAAAELESKLSGRRCVEMELETARKSVEAVEEKLRTLEQQRGAIEKNVNDERSTLEQLRVQAQETRVRRTTLEEQLNESGHAIEQALANVPDEATADSCEEQVEKMERRITRLGPINLAAIDEYDSQAERKQYLDSQHDDLAEALETLRQAIQKIDRETRTRFKDTYERVNAGLQEAFPRLFGGGTAFLEMTGDDLLNTGITMVARPPGKRNTSIHLLSGGEKALCAIALVFSIFELNPAPFCLLDEVDAPLDDANVGRFCELVKSMTDRVQFIVVTHSKITMEMTHQLLGVTMSEPGISRLVAVDVDEAAELAVV
jgi:chromosome segregation protein